MCIRDRCGYARSDGGSASKVCHDLYYLKHQSLWFDTVILARTFFTLASRVTSREHHEALLGTEPRAVAVESQG